jgi:nicotinamidase-related amidase
MFNPLHNELLVIDVQERLCAAMPDGDGDGERGSALRAIDNLLYVAGALAMPVTLTEQYPRGLGSTVAEVVAALPQHAARFEKLAFSALREPEFPAPTRANVLLVGMETHICVALTALDLLERGVGVTVVADGCMSRRPADRLRGLELCRAAGARIVSSETALFGLIERAGTPLFKEISRRIR